MKLPRILIGLNFLFLISCSGLTSERGNDERITHTVKVAKFEKISVSGAFEVILEQNDSDLILLETDENLVEFVHIGVKGSTLYINSERRLISREGVKIRVPVQKLTVISSSGASTILSTEKVMADELALLLSGAGKIDLILDAKAVEVEISGVTLAYLEGSTNNLTVTMSGAGSLEADHFVSKNCAVSISGVGNVMVNVSDSLNATVSGLGKVTYVGNPKSVQGDVSGVGDVSKVDNDKL